MQHVVLTSEGGPAGGKGLHCYVAYLWCKQRHHIKHTCAHFTIFPFFFLYFSSLLPLFPPFFPYVPLPTHFNVLLVPAYNVSPFVFDHAVWMKSVSTFSHILFLQKKPLRHHAFSPYIFDLVKAHEGDRLGNTYSVSYLNWGIVSVVIIWP